MPQKIYTIEVPGGKVIDIEGPEGAENDVLSFVSSLAPEELIKYYKPTIAPTLLESRKENSRMEFERNLPQNQRSFSGGFVDNKLTAGLENLRDFSLDAFESLGGTPKDTVGGTVLGTIKNIGGGLSDFLGRLEQSPTEAMKAFGELGVETVKAPFEGPYNMATADSPAGFAKGAAQTTTQTLPVAGAGYKLGKNVATNTARNLPPTLMAKSKVWTEQALRPRTRELKAVAEGISDDLAQRGIEGWTGGTFDENIYKMLDEDIGILHKAEDSIPKNATISRFQESVIPRIDSAINTLKERASKGGEFKASDATIQHLENIRNDLIALGPDPNFHLVKEFRRNLDQDLQRTGAHRQTNSAAQHIETQIKRQVANVLRDTLNELSPQLEAANRRYRVSRAAADIVEDRELGGVGKIEYPSNMDVIMGLGGYAVQGLPGSIALSTFRRATQSRGLAAAKSRTAQRFINPDDLPPKPRDMQIALNRAVNPMPARLETPDQYGTSLEAMQQLQREGASARLAEQRFQPPKEGFSSAESAQIQAHLDDAVKGGTQLSQRSVREANAAKAMEIDKGLKNQLGQTVQDVGDSRLKQSYGLRGEQEFPAPGSGLTSQPRQELLNRMSTTKKLPPSPFMDKLTAGVDTTKLTPYDLDRLNRMANDAKKLFEQGNVDAVDAIDSLIIQNGGTKSMRAKFLSGHEGQNVLGGLIKTMQLNSVDDVKFYEKRLQGLIQRELKRGKGPVEAPGPQPLPPPPDKPPTVTETVYPRVKESSPEVQKALKALEDAEAALDKANAERTISSERGKLGLEGTGKTGTRKPLRQAEAAVQKAREDLLRLMRGLQ